ncbi:MAG: hypothetical protein AAF728_05270 [Cyanobacteria bacterium P01_D01_bin.128]
MVEAKRPSDAQESQSASSQPAPETKVPAPVQPTLAIATLDLAAQDVRTVLREQREESQLLTTKLNILFVTNGALLTSLSISRLILSGSIFNVGEVVGFLLSFTLLVRAFLPRQVAVTPNLQDRKFLENYLLLSYEEYQLQMLVNLSQAYNANKQRLDDVSQTLKYAAYATWATAVIMLAHILSTFWTVGNYDLQLLDML